MKKYRVKENVSPVLELHVWTRVYNDLMYSPTYKGHNGGAYREEVVLEHMKGHCYYIADRYLKEINIVLENK